LGNGTSPLRGTPYRYQNDFCLRFERPMLDLETVLMVSTVVIAQHRPRSHRTERRVNQTVDLLLVQVRFLDFLIASRWFGNAILLITSRPDTRTFSIASTPIPVLLWGFHPAEKRWHEYLVTGHPTNHPYLFPEDPLVIEVKARGPWRSKKGVGGYLHLLPYFP